MSNSQSMNVGAMTNKHTASAKKPFMSRRRSGISQNTCILCDDQFKEIETGSEVAFLSGESFCETIPQA